MFSFTQAAKQTTGLGIAMRQQQTKTTVTTYNGKDSSATSTADARTTKGVNTGSIRSPYRCQEKAIANANAKTSIEAVLGEPHFISYIAGARTSGGGDTGHKRLNNSAVDQKAPHSRPGKPRRATVDLEHEGTIRERYE